MRRVLGYCPNRAIAAVVVGCFVAGAVGTMARPGSAGPAVVTSISVNRALKGDRLMRVRGPHEKHDAAPRSSNRVHPTSTGRPPLGCDPAFSVIGDPSRALQAARCLT